MRGSIKEPLRPTLGLIALLAASLLQAGDTTVLTGVGYGPFRRLPGTSYASLEFDHFLGKSCFGGWLSADVARDGQFVGLGPMVQTQLSPSWSAAISTGPGWYSNQPGLNLGSMIEFRSTAYLLFKVSDRYRLGLAASHYSNGGIARHNPGAETLRLLLIIPFRP